MSDPLATVYDRKALYGAIKHLPPLDCAGCTACCMNGQILPLLGDEDPSLYETEEISGVTCIKASSDSAGCIYCKDGCSIYEKRPKICRTFDCRGLVLINTRAELDDAIHKGHFKRAIVKAGRDRLRKYRRSLP